MYYYCTMKTITKNDVDKTELFALDIGKTLQINHSQYEYIKIRKPFSCSLCWCRRCLLTGVHNLIIEHIVSTQRLHQLLEKCLKLLLFRSFSLTCIQISLTNTFYLIVRVLFGLDEFYWKLCHALWCNASIVYR